MLRDHRLTLIGRDAAALTELTGSLPDARWFALDLSRPETFARSVGRWDAPIDGLLHVAGLLGAGQVETLAVSDWQRVLNVNLVAVAELTRLALPALRAAGGTVALVNSGAGLHAGQGRALYSASKFGLRAFADALRSEEPELRVVSYFPGRVGTDMQRELRAVEGGDYVEQDYLDVTLAAQVLVQTLQLPNEAAITELRLQPTRRRRPSNSG